MQIGWRSGKNSLETFPLGVRRDVSLRKGGHSSIRDAHHGFILDDRKSTRVRLRVLHFDFFFFLVVFEDRISFATFSSCRRLGTEKRLKQLGANSVISFRRRGSNSVWVPLSFSVYCTLTVIDV